MLNGWCCSSVERRVRVATRRGISGLRHSGQRLTAGRAAMARWPRWGPGGGGASLLPAWRLRRCDGARDRDRQERSNHPRGQGRGVVVPERARDRGQQWPWRARVTRLLRARWCRLGVALVLVAPVDQQPGEQGDNLAFGGRVEGDELGGRIPSSGAAWRTAAGGAGRARGRGPGEDRRRGAWDGGSRRFGVWGAVMRGPARPGRPQPADPCRSLGAPDPRVPVADPSVLVNQRGLPP
jgi:hypothetical protein